MKLIISVHPSIRPTEMGNEIVVECSNLSVFEAIWRSLEPFDEFRKRIFKDNKVPRPDILFIASGIELRTTKRIYEKCSNFSKVRLIPVTHGG